MTHEIHSPLAERHRDLPDRDRSSYQTLKLVIQRQGRQTATVSVVFTNASNGRLDDTRLGCVRVSTVAADGTPLPPGEMLERALRALYPV